MNKLIEALDLTTTENGCLTYKTTDSAVLDLFSQIGAMRKRPATDIINMFKAAYTEDALLATKLAFYTRDVREGKGERQIFRTILVWLANNHPETVLKNIPLIAEYGRWDDVLTLLGTPLEKEALKVVEKQWFADIEALSQNNSVSLLGKWLFSENTSSLISRKKGTVIRKFLGYTSRAYRKTLTELRKKIEVVERSMCAKEWSEINYEHVPSKAALNYKKAFKRNDEDRYSTYIEEVTSGTKTIKTSTLNPVELIEKLRKGGYDATLEALWNNQIDNVAEDGLVVCDVSGSMLSYQNPTPISASTGLALYYAQFNKGAFKDCFITFSSTPSLQKVQGKTLYEKYNNLCRAEWGMSTNLEAVFELILGRATQAKVPTKEMPKVIYIISDMEFNCVHNTSQTMFENIRERYSKAGYELPRIVFWNVASRGNKAPVKKDENGVLLVSGYSTDVFKYVITGEDYNPYKFCLEVLNQERYNPITV